MISNCSGLWLFFCQALRNQGGGFPFKVFTSLLRINFMSSCSECGRTGITPFLINLAAGIPPIGAT